MILKMFLLVKDGIDLKLGTYVCYKQRNQKNVLRGSRFYSFIDIMSSFLFMEGHTFFSN